MENNFDMGLDDILEIVTEKDETQGIEAVPKSSQPKRKPFVLWTVGGMDYRLKLTASAICKLEQKYKKNLLLLITDAGLPPIAVMLTVIQAAMLQYHHKMTNLAVQKVYDQYVDEGGDQNKLMTDVVMPLMGVSGFFTQSQMEVLTEEMKDMDSAL